MSSKEKKSLAKLHKPSKTKPEFEPNEDFELTIAQEIYSGHIPSPAMFRGYEEVLPGAADRILALTENEQKLTEKDMDNRRILAEKSIDTKREATKSAQTKGFTLGLVGMVMGFTLIYLDKDAYGMGVFLTALGSLIWTSLYGKKQKTKQ